MRVDAVASPQGVDPIPFRLRVDIDPERVKVGPEVSATLAWGRDDILEDVGKGGEGDFGRVAAAGIGDGAAEAGVLLGQGFEELAIGAVQRPAGQRMDRSGIVKGRLVVDAANDRDLVHPLRHLREVFANLNARDRRGDRSERTADLGRSVGLHVPRVEMARPAVIKDQDASPDGAGHDRGRLRRRHRRLGTP